VDATFKSLRRVTGRVAVAGLDLLFPPRCAACGHRGVWVCARCLADFKPIHPPFCNRCGTPENRPCICARLPREIDWLRSAAWDEGWLRDAIRLFKYEGEFDRARQLTELALPFIAGFPRGVVLVPVPLHPDRERGRGYNQADKLACQLSRMSKIDLMPVLARVRATQQQVGLSAIERGENMVEAFRTVAGIQVEGRKFMLIDDVTTTGATLGACAGALKMSGASWVGGLTIARES
jgi:ComF family protein